MEHFWSTFEVFLDYFWTTYKNLSVSKCIEFTLGMEVPKDTRDKTFISLLWLLGCHSNHSDTPISLSSYAIQVHIRYRGSSEQERLTNQLSCWYCKYVVLASYQVWRFFRIGETSYIPDYNGNSIGMATTVI